MVPRLDGNASCLGVYYLIVITTGVFLFQVDDFLLGLIWLVVVCASWPVVHRRVEQAESPETETEAAPGP
jgi:hypothetical protein